MIKHVFNARILLLVLFYLYCITCLPFMLVLVPRFLYLILILSGRAGVGRIHEI